MNNLSSYCGLVDAKIRASDFAETKSVTKSRLHCTQNSELRQKKAKFFYPISALAYKKWSKNVGTLL